MKLNISANLPKKVRVVELLLRDGLQHEPHFIPTETKVWFFNHLSECGFDTIEVTNFAHPSYIVQTRDAEEVLKRIQRTRGVNTKCYAMNKKAFERAAEARQKGYGPDIVAFAISTTDEHCLRNVGKTKKQYLKEIPEMLKIANSNAFTVDMAISCVYGCPIKGSVPVEATLELIERGLDMGIGKFTPCDTTGIATPLTAYEYMSAITDRFPDVDCHVAHFHESRGMALTNYLAALLAGANVCETSLGALGGQPSFIVDRIVTQAGPLYSDSDITWNASTEDVLVMLDAIGIQVEIDIDKVLEIGRVLEWVLGRSLPPLSTKSGRFRKTGTHLNIDDGLKFIPPYGTAYWCYPKEVTS
jgi:hydroxymethylglutaryl-CoA lyase